MIIVDLNQVMISNLMMQLGTHTNAKIEENIVRHMILNSIRSYKVKFGAEFGELVVPLLQGEPQKESAKLRPRLARNL